MSSISVAVTACLTCVIVSVDFVMHHAPAGMGARGINGKRDVGNRKQAGTTRHAAVAAGAAAVVV